MSNLDNSLTSCAIMEKEQANHPRPGAPSSLGSKEYIVTVFKDAFRDFLERNNVAAPPFVNDPILEQRVRETIDSWGLAGTLRPDITSGCVIASGAYRHVSFEARVKLALYTATIAVVDDPVYMASLAPGELQRQLREPDPTSILGRFLETVYSLWEFYPTFGACAIIASSIQFINVNILDLETRGFESRHSLPYVEYRRVLTGASEAFACFIWEKSRFPDPSVYLEALPDVYVYMARINDLLSFYKEELAGETGNYIGDRVRVTQSTAETTLREVVDEAVSSAERVRAILGEGPACDAWEAFAGGYLNFHTCNPRYRLDEVRCD